MARLKFERRPVDRSLAHYQTREEHEAWVRERWAQYPGKGALGPCSCGFYADDWLVSCDDAQRIRCLANVDRRLEYDARQAHLRGLRAKREFPGPPCDGKGAGWCRWCGKEIINPKTGRRHPQRTWCPDGGCLGLYNLHTFHWAQRRYLRERDGEGCKICQHPYTEVDHFIPLGAAWEAFPDPARRRWFFSPANLQLLCTGAGNGHHVAKSKEDVALIKACQANGPDWARARVLDILAEAGLLKGASTKEAP